jgi:hypothetical protein
MAGEVLSSSCRVEKLFRHSNPSLVTRVMRPMSQERFHPFDEGPLELVENVGASIVPSFRIKSVRGYLQEGRSPNSESPPRQGIGQNEVGGGTL